MGARPRGFAGVPQRSDGERRHGDTHNDAQRAGFEGSGHEVSQRGAVRRGDGVIAIERPVLKQILFARTSHDDQSERLVGLVHAMDRLGDFAVAKRLPLAFGNGRDRRLHALLSLILPSPLAWSCRPWVGGEGGGGKYALVKQPGIYEMPLYWIGVEALINPVL